MGDIENNVKYRLINYLDVKGVSKSEFGRMIGVSSAYISSMRKSIAPDKLKAIATQFPDLNLDWLLTGEGEMLKGSGSSVGKGLVRAAVVEEAYPVRLFDLTPTATFTDFMASVAVPEPDTIAVLPEPGETLTPYHCVFTVYGDSMLPQIQSGDRVLCLELPPSKWHTVSHGIAVVAFSSPDGSGGESFVIKRILKNLLATDNCLLLGSDNPAFPQRVAVPLASIRSLFRAERLLSRHLS